jgi:CheY-like chemotaxis protein
MGIPADQAESAQQRLTILVVEDEPLIRISIADHLRSVGYLVVEAGTADEAVSVLSSGSKIHLVFCDVELPGMMGGVSLAAWVRNHYRSIPVILTSGVGSVVSPLERQHLIPFLQKPYQPRDAEELIASVIAASPHARGSE